MKRVFVLALTAIVAGCGGAPADKADEAPFRFQNKAIELPADGLSLAPGPGNDLIAQNCTGCHSAEMLITQPPLDAKTWAAEVAKMRKVYHAPIDPADDARLIAALSALPGQSGAR
ncbi:MAG: cytochrome C nitrite reductase [Sphingomonas sp.]|uniref:cytochrome C nitrite reductase n=1 Tax=Sphingomonas sp. TaxID=28214 RepID=UPI000DB12434|nr:cytochrome C nitrite reductase [Zymomonas sp.]MBA4773676.1 cytochrome C nitrite reductase [Sphingomonas sp.]PZP18903.1 MAG: cytochrome C nitrite reductase [Sphingomonas hengshuiensis]